MFFEGCGDGSVVHVHLYPREKLGLPSYKWILRVKMFFLLCKEEIPAKCCSDITPRAILSREKSRGQTTWICYLITAIFLRIVLW